MWMNPIISYWTSWIIIHLMSRTTCMEGNRSIKFEWKVSPPAPSVRPDVSLADRSWGGIDVRESQVRRATHTHTHRDFTSLVHVARCRCRCRLINFDETSVKTLTWTVWHWNTRVIRWLLNKRKHGGKERSLLFDWTNKGRIRGLDGQTDRQVC